MLINFSETDDISVILQSGVPWYEMERQETVRESVESEWHSDSKIKIDKKDFVIVYNNKVKEFWNCHICSERKSLRLKICYICGHETIWEV